MNRDTARSDDGRKTVLIVEDDPGTQRVLASGLATSLGMFDVLTADHGQEAVELLETRTVDVVVTDLAMPVMDGFALIGYLTNRATTPPVVVLSALAPTTVAEGLDGYGGLTVLRKPAGYPEVARAVLEALERRELGQLAGIPLASVLQLVEAERRTCSLGVTSGRRRGRLHFESGRLINAFSEDFGADGEAAAFDILTWERTAIAFERLPEGVRRTIDMPTQQLLIEVARRQDALREREAALAQATNSVGGHGVGRTVAAEPAAPEPAAPEPAAAEADTVTEPGTEPAPDATHELDTPPSTELTDAAHAATSAGDDATADALDAPHGADATALPGTTPEAPAAPAPMRAAAQPSAEADPVRPSEDRPAGFQAIDAEAAPPPTVPRIAPQEPATGEATAHGTAIATDGAGDPASDAGMAATPHAPTLHAPLEAPSHAPHADLIAAIERLTHRVLDADAALAAVADEVDAFRAAQHRYDDAVRRQDERRRAVEDARRDVADLARQILTRLDGLFDAFDAEADVVVGAAAASEPSPRTNP